MLESLFTLQRSKCSIIGNRERRDMLYAATFINNKIISILLQIIFAIALITRDND